MEKPQRPEALAFELLARQFIDLATVLSKYDAGAANDFLDRADVAFRKTIAVISTHIPHESDSSAHEYALLNVSAMMGAVVERAREGVQSKTIDCTRWH